MTHAEWVAYYAEYRRAGYPDPAGVRLLPFSFKPQRCALLVSAALMRMR